MKLKKHLDDQKRNISRVSRLHYLQDLEEMLNNFFIPYTQVVNEPYSMQELCIIVRIIKKLIHQLYGTSKYRLFSGKHEKHKKVSPDKTQELRNQKTDEIRLNHTKLTAYNPLSEKYKALKKDLLQKLNEE